MVRLSKVLLLHGIWNPAWWMWPLAWHLRAAGFDARLFGYRGALQGPEAAVASLARHIGAQDGRPLALVGHSLGGMVALETARRYPELPIGRIVCLGSPLCGSGVARRVAGLRWCAWALGHGRTLLLDGVAPWAGGIPVGMIAGARPMGLGRLFVEMAESDGTVAVAETRLDGLADHCVVPASHSGLVFSPEAARQALAFLREGRFRAN
ncbi:alpha/beta fold hydrolase [Stenotrophomonas sp. MMGLT7]|uniref:alpha/beta fold hydrolase n=1 Tax=Stenotrophomonas sp. MMGLT7 TaxID=2901227 RepID=UPI001E3DC52B|nr:alpha/beta fold hydrolase [Stenotrophomonas sp. MMGLT7]MCD7097446.1 alpha/beta hydrolase [Stenotrophomonas sp. MMGLT7]